MSWKSKIYQAFLIVCFATLCYSEVNLARNKDTKIFIKNTKSVDGSEKSFDYCLAGVCELVVDLGAPQEIKTVKLKADIQCKKKAEIVYKIGLKEDKNRAVFDFTCRDNNPHNKEPSLSINDKITCDSMKAFRFVVFKCDIECFKVIHELQVFGSSPDVNLALNKKAEFINRAMKGVDGLDKTQVSCGYSMCEMVVDLGAPHVIESVEVKADVYCQFKSEIAYKVRLMDNKNSAEFDFTCIHINQRNKNHHIFINDKITCESEKAFQFVVLSMDFLCFKSITEFQVFGSSTTRRNESDRSHQLEEEELMK